VSAAGHHPGSWSSRATGRRSRKGVDPGHRPFSQAWVAGTGFGALRSLIFGFLKAVGRRPTFIGPRPRSFISAVHVE
jgi:hypothetical protein